MWERDQKWSGGTEKISLEVVSKKGKRGKGKEERNGKGKGGTPWPEGRQRWMSYWMS